MCKLRNKLVLLKFWISCFNYKVLIFIILLNQKTQNKIYMEVKDEWKNKGNTILVQK